MAGGNINMLRDHLATGIIPNAPSAKLPKLPAIGKRTKVKPAKFPRVKTKVQNGAVTISSPTIGGY